jgi:hypothetical protein
MRERWSDGCRTCTHKERRLAFSNCTTVSSFTWSLAESQPTQPQPESCNTLPNVPSFPSIQIPSSFRASVDNHLQYLLSTRTRIFLRMHSLPSLLPTVSLCNDAQTSPTNVSPVSSNLRKAYSVDSFSRHRRGAPAEGKSRYFPFQ